MDLLSAVGFISDAFAETKKVKEFKDEFVGAFIDWIRPLFLKDDPKLVDALETTPEDGKTQGRLETRLGEMIKNETFLNQLEEWMKKPGSERLHEKNILNAGKLSGASLHVGDKNSGDEGFDRKNIVDLKEGDFTGDFRIGDG